MLKATDPYAFVDLAEIDPEARLLDMSEKGDEWHTDDSSLEEYSVLAGLPEDFKTGLGGMILKHLGTDGGNVGIDIAGGTNGAALRQLLEMGVLEKALVTNYTDARTAEARAVRGLNHRDGDICERDTWEGIDKWIDTNTPEGLSLVMHRPAGTLQDFPTQFYTGAFKFLLERTRSGGVLFLQVPEPLVIPSPERSLKPVCEEVAEEVEVLFSNVDPNSDFPVIPAHVLLRKN